MAGPTVCEKCGGHFGVTVEDRIELVRALSTPVVAILVVIGMLVLIYQQRGEQAQAWAILAVAVTWAFNSNSQQRAYAQGAAAGSSIPTTTVSAGNPPKVVVEAPPD